MGGGCGGGGRKVGADGALRRSWWLSPPAFHAPSGLRRQPGRLCRQVSWAEVKPQPRRDDRRTDELTGCPHRVHLVRRVTRARNPLGSTQGRYRDGGPFLLAAVLVASLNLREQARKQDFHCVQRKAK